MDLKTVSISEHSKRYRGIHAEVPGAIVNIYTGSRNSDGQGVTRVEILADDYRGEEWRIRDEGRLHKALSVPVVQMEQPFYHERIERKRACRGMMVAFNCKTTPIVHTDRVKHMSPTASSLARLMSLASNSDYRFCFSPDLLLQKQFTITITRRDDAETPRAELVIP